MKMPARRFQLQAGMAGDRHPAKPAPELTFSRCEDNPKHRPEGSKGFTYRASTLSRREPSMAAPKKPGQSTGNSGGIYQEVGPQGGKRPNYVTVPDNKPLPPTTTPGSGWTPVKVTPGSKR